MTGLNPCTFPLFDIFLGHSPSLPPSLTPNSLVVLRQID